MFSSVNSNYMFATAKLITLLCGPSSGTSVAFGPLSFAGGDKIVLPVNRGGSPVFVPVCELGWAEELGRRRGLCLFVSWLAGRNKGSCSSNS